MKIAMQIPGKEGRRVSFRVMSEVIKVDKEKGAIVAQAYPDGQLVFSVARRMYRNIACVEPKNCRMLDNLLMPGKITAVAHLAKGDAWDEKKGVEVAMRKLDKKIRLAVKGRLVILGQEMAGTASELMALE